MDAMFSFKAFLSHRYKSPDVNIYFFNLFKEIAEVQFEVDEGTLSTNVTRLERMVRDTDAFIGIYPFPGSVDEAHKPEELKKQSRYFRLEIDLAVRSQKTAIIFFDRRYGELLKPPADFFSYAFDLNEITGSGGFPSYNKHKRWFENFCEVVKTRKAYDDVSIYSEKDVVGLIVPANQNNEQGYTTDCIEKIKKNLADHTYSNIQLIQWPPVLDSKLFSLLEMTDLAVVDLGRETASYGLPAFLHGKSIPMIRLKHISENDKDSSSHLDDFLFGGVEVGYVKDTIVWSDPELLQKELSQKLEIINANIRRINTNEEAMLYFRSAALRKEVVFLSYSGKDVDIAKEISASFKKYFQKVFDYRDGESITPGQPWLQNIFEQLSASAIGISLFSDTYFESGNCVHEAQQMVAKSDSGKMKLFPIKLYTDPLKEVPSFYESIQYLRRSEFTNTDEIAKKIIDLISAKPSA
jgi:hypothetical protein